MVLNQPAVSVVIPARNEEDHIARCLDSILANDYPADKLEILVIDGRSRDDSRDIVQTYTLHHDNIQLLDNPEHIAAAAMNLGIQHAHGEIIIRADAHTIYASDYVRNCIELLETTAAKNVGGVQRAVGTDYVSETIAVATTTPFGIGGAPFRHAEQEMWVDTVYLGAWHKSTLEDLGGFDESWVVNEDYELNVRLRQAGGKILLSPRIKSWYNVRPSLKTLARQWFRYGFWKVRTLVAHPGSLRRRQLAPPSLVAALLVSLILFAISPSLVLLVPALYAVVNVSAAVVTAARKGWKYLPLLPIAFATIHLSWGSGFLLGLFRWGIPRVGAQALRQAFRSPGGTS